MWLSPLHMTTPNANLLEFVADNESVSKSVAESHWAELDAEVTEIVGDILQSWRIPHPDDASLYRAKVWSCIEFHWGKLAAKRPIRFHEVIERLQNGNLFHADTGENLLRDIVLATALQLRQEAAALQFQRLYSDFASHLARRLAQERADEVFGNFVAELILPRENAPPRIATYRGLTSLKSWLRVVMTNRWIACTRSEGRANQILVDASTDRSMVDSESENRECVTILQPIFKTICAAIEPAQRLMLQMLIIDEVPQNAVARSFGVNSGTITRRRDRACAKLFAELQRLARESKRTDAVMNCLQWALANNDHNLNRRLGGLLAEGMTMNDDEAVKSNGARDK